MQAKGRAYQKVITPPNTQNTKVKPTLLVDNIMLEGVEYIPAPTTRLMMRNAVDHVPSFLSESVQPRGQRRY